MLISGYHSILNAIEIAFPYISFVLYLTLSIIVSLHIIFKKQESKTALAWIALVWFSPFFGSMLYVGFGINRVWRRKKLLKSPYIKKIIAELNHKNHGQHNVIPDHIKQFSNIKSNLIDFPLCAGNWVEPLINGEEAYKKMLNAIEKAEKSISLCSYIFDNDSVGQQFANALIKASQKGVEVRVLVDAMGLRYTFPPIFYKFKHTKVKAKRFLPTVVPWKMSYINLRNHRKILVVDGKHGFTGGMNIRQGHCLDSNSQYKIQDVHFYIKGPVVKQMQMTFVMDWLYASGENLSGEAWFPQLQHEGDSIIRSIVDGPDEDMNTILLVLCSVISQAKRSIRIINPYFLPNETLVTLLKVTQKRGVRVDIMVPEKSNLDLVHWASQKTLRQLSAWGCTVYLSKAPFEHTKMILVDDTWAFIGSANLDERSLRLNFEFNLEVYDKNFIQSLNEIFEGKLKRSKKLKLYKESPSLLEQFKEGVARLFKQYL